MSWAIVRAHVQSVTIDEAVTYMNFILPADPTYWAAHANNHVLNSMLARIFKSVFGPSHLVLRSGALTGAAVFILASYFLSRLIGESVLLRVSLFICLVFNPFVFDFLVAARGYGLASGFLLATICLIAYAKKSQIADSSRSPIWACVLASICIALSFASNFSFAFADAASIVVLYLWISGGFPFKTRAKLALACFLPGLLVAGALTGPVLLNWDPAELVYGAESLSETLQSVYEASFYELPQFLSARILLHIPVIVISMFGVFAAWRLALILIHWRSLRDARGRWSLAFAAVPVITVSVTLFMHSVFFRLTRTPLPKDRTAMFVVILATLFLGGLAAVPISTLAGDISRRGMTILMVVLGSYFLLCLRMNYFKEWKWDSDTDRIYSVLASYNHACGLKDIAVNWRYDGAMNYYRAVSGRETMPPFSSQREYPAGKRAYVVFQPEDQDFLANHALQLVYRAPSGAAVALDRGIEPPPGESACPMTLPDQNK